MDIIEAHKLTGEIATKARRTCRRTPYQQIVFDIETTGLNEWLDEILQISIMNDKGEILMNEYVKPFELKEWPEAERIHGITPEMVKNCHTLDHYITDIQKIMWKATGYITYNGGFDMGFLESAGIEFRSVPHYDVMLKFAPIYGEYNSYYGEYKWQKLTTCADYYGYKFAAHDSLEDCRATLYCYQQMTKDKR